MTLESFCGRIVRTRFISILRRNWWNHGNIKITTRYNNILYPLKSKYQIVNLCWKKFWNKTGLWGCATNNMKWTRKKRRVGSPPSHEFPTFSIPHPWYSIHPLISRRNPRKESCCCIRGGELQPGDADVRAACNNNNRRLAAQESRAGRKGNAVSHLYDSRLQFAN